MSTNGKFVDVVVSFELYRHAFFSMSTAQLYTEIHKFNDHIRPLVEELMQLAEADNITNEEKEFHLCRIEKLSEITFYLAMEMDRHIRQVAR